MRVARVALLAGVALVFSGCSEDIEIRPVERAGQEVSAFDLAYMDGKAHYAAGQTGLAILDFDKALARNPRSAAALNALGAAYDDLGRHDIAQHYFELALMIEPNSPDTLNNLGISLALANMPGAQAMLDKAAAVDPANSVIRRNAVQLASAPQASQPLPAAVRALLEEAAPPSDAEAGRPRLIRTGLDTYELEAAGSGVPALGRAVGATAGNPMAWPTPAVHIERLPDPLAYPIAEPADAPASPHEADPQPDAAVAAPASVGVLDIANGVGRTRMAARFRTFLGAAGLLPDRITNVDTFDVERSFILYRSGHADAAAQLAGLLPIPVPAKPDDAMERDDIRLVLGRDLLPFDRHLEDLYP